MGPKMIFWEKYGLFPTTGHHNMEANKVQWLDFHSLDFHGFEKFKPCKKLHYWKSVDWWHCTEVSGTPAGGCSPAGVLHSMQLPLSWSPAHASPLAPSSWSPPCLCLPCKSKWRPRITLMVKDGKHSFSIIQSDPGALISQPSLPADNWRLRRYHFTIIIVPVLVHKLLEYLMTYFSNMVNRICSEQLSVFSCWKLTALLISIH